jgi:uncharacterized protein
LTARDYFAEALQQRRNRKKRGFATLSPERHREIASQGGKAAHLKGTAHEFDSAEGRAASLLRHVGGA